MRLWYAYCTIILRRESNFKRSQFLFRLQKRSAGDGRQPGRCAAAYHTCQNTMRGPPMFVPNLRCSPRSDGALLSTGSEFLMGKRCLLHPDALSPSLPAPSPISGLEFSGEMRSFLHSRALLPLIPPTPFSHKGRRGSLVVLMHETGDDIQGLAKKSPPVSIPLLPHGEKGEFGRPDA
jgi:hypothetical protein